MELVVRATKTGHIYKVYITIVNLGTLFDILIHFKSLLKLSSIEDL